LEENRFPFEKLPNRGNFRTFLWGSKKSSIHFKTSEKFWNSWEHKNLL